MKNKDFTKIFKKHHINKWVALSPDEKCVVGYGFSPKEALKKSRKKGVKDPVFTFVVKDYDNLVS